MEQGVNCFLKDHNFTLAGRKVELIVADTGGNPAGAKNKVQELVERDNVDVITGPLGRVRAAGHHRLHRAAQDADAEPRRRRGHDAAQAQPLFPARVGDLGAGDAAPGRLRGEGAEVQARGLHRRGFRLRLRADGRLPARLRGRGRQGAEEAVGAARHRRQHALSSPRSPIATWCARAMPARPRSSS